MELNELITNLDNASYKCGRKAENNALFPAQSLDDLIIIASAHKRSLVHFIETGEAYIVD